MKNTKLNLFSFGEGQSRGGRENKTTVVIVLCRRTNQNGPINDNQINELVEKDGRPARLINLKETKRGQKVKIR